MRSMISCERREANMKNKIFSPRLYVQALSKVRTLGIAMLITVVLINIFLPINGISENDRYRSDTGIYVYQDPDGVQYEFSNKIDDPSLSFIYGYDYAPNIQEVRDTEFAPALWALLGFAPLMVYMMFSFLNDRKKSDFYHALPQTRVCVYLSMTAAIFTWFAATILISVGINAILWSFAKFYSFTAMTVISNLVFYFVLALFMSGFMAAAMMLTGTEITDFLIYCFLLFFPVYAYELFAEAVNSHVDWFPRSVFNDGILSLNRFLPLMFSTTGNGGYLADVPVLVYSTVIGLAMFAIAGVLYHFRRSETAKRSAPNHILQHVYRIIFTTAAAILLPISFFFGDGELALLIVLVTIVVYILYELLTTKKIKKMVSSLPLLVVPFLLAGIFSLSVMGVKWYTYNVLPETEDVTGITFDEFDYWGGDYYAYCLMDREITNKEAIALVTDAMHEHFADPDVSTTIFSETIQTVEFHLKNGRTVTRCFRVPKQTMIAVCTMPDVAEGYAELPKDVKKIYLSTSYSTNGGIQHIWETFQEEYAALSPEGRYFCAGGDYTEDYYYDEPMLMVEVKKPEGGYVTLNFRLSTKYTPKTLEALSSSYGSEVHILEALQLYKNSGRNDLITIKFIDPTDGVTKQYLQIDSIEFFKYIAIDEHLFLSHKGVTTNVEIDGMYLTLYLTIDEIHNLINHPMLKQSPRDEITYGIFTDMTNQKGMTVSEEQRLTINRMLGIINPIAELDSKVCLFYFF